jgi:hypothetical protein
LAATSTSSRLATMPGLGSGSAPAALRFTNIEVLGTVDQ